MLLGWTMLIGEGALRMRRRCLREDAREEVVVVEGEGVTVVDGRRGFMEGFGEDGMGAREVRRDAPALQ